MVGWVGGQLALSGKKKKKRQNKPKTPVAAGERVGKGKDYRTVGLEMETYVNAVDAGNSRGARGPGGTLLAWGTSLTENSTRGLVKHSGQRGKPGRDVLRAPPRPRKGASLGRQGF